MDWSSRASVLRRPARFLAIALLCLATFQVSYGVLAWGWASWYGQDLGWYVEATARLLADGDWFQDRQLHGPYTIRGGDVLYPPVTAFFFLPWLVLPTWTFIAVPIALTASVVAIHRPAWWAWPILGACLIWPDTQVKVIAANPFLWITTALALGTVFRWPASFILLKPTLALFALIGVRDRRWWLVVGLLILGSLLVREPTLDYPRVLLDARGGGLFYSLWDLPLMTIPIVAWLTGLRSPLNVARISAWRKHRQC